MCNDNSPMERKVHRNECPFPFQKGGIAGSNVPESFPIYRRGPMVVVGISNTKTSWKLERVRIEARNIRPSLKRRLEQRGGVSRLKHSPARFPHS